MGTARNLLGNFHETDYLPTIVHTGSGSQNSDVSKGQTVNDRPLFLKTKPFLRTWVFALSLFVFLWHDSAVSQNKSLWVTAYYPLWSAPTMYPEAVDFSNVTHIVHFCANPVQDYPYLDVLVPAPPGKYNQDSVNIQWGGNYNGNNPPLWRKIDIQQTLLTRAHAKGVRVVLSVGGIYGAGAQSLSFITADPVRLDIFVRNACAYAKRKGYDGIELDWEFPKASEKQNFSSLIMRFRKELDTWKPRGLFFAAVNHTPWPSVGYDRDSLVAAFDQINVMTYEMYNGSYSNIKTGYNTPIQLPVDYPGYSGYALEQPGRAMRAWIQFGVPASKLGLGISFLTAEFFNVQPPVEPARPFGWHNWGYVKDIPADGRHWDNTSLVPWQASGTKFITYEDTASVRRKVEYARKLQLGGLMLYDLLGGYVPQNPEGKREELLRAVRDDVRSMSSSRK